MSSSIFEISLRDEYSFGDIKDVLLSCLGKEDSSVVDDLYYWMLPLEDQVNSIGLEISCSDLGYKTLVRGSCSFDLYGESLGRLATCLSFKLKTEVAIGDYINDKDLVTGRYMVFYPDGSIKHGYESINTGDVFEIDVIN